MAWYGVRNYQARNFMRDQMRVGDQVFFYHSNCDDPGIAGLATVSRLAYPDQTQFDPGNKYFDPKATPETPRWFNVDVKLVKKIRLISLDELRNGLGLEKDLVFPARPIADPEMRESMSIWMFDETGAFGFTRMGIEAEASSWDDRLFQANFAFAGGRILNGAGRGPAPSPLGTDGRATGLGAGSIAFRCIEPFHRWAMVFDGPAIDGHVAQQIARTLDPDASHARAARGRDDDGHTGLDPGDEGGG